MKLIQKSNVWSRIHTNERHTNEELSEVEVILMKDIEYGKVIGLYNINLKYCLKCKTNKEKLLYLIVSLNPNNQFYSRILYMLKKYIWI